MIRQVVERRDNHEHRVRGEEPLEDESANNLSLRSEKGHDEGIRDHRQRTMVEEGCRFGEDIEAAMESDGGDSGTDGCERRLMKSDVGDGSETGYNTQVNVLSAAEAS
ncbi:hypothetical protein GYH30_035845 [Glycine max]|nr:hypothetical protein GYH30_035845 [Glycine max]